jgi:hypothetical protein
MLRKNLLELMLIHGEEVLVQGGTGFADENTIVDNKIRSFVFHTVNAIVVVLIFTHYLCQVGFTFSILVLSWVFYEVNRFRPLIGDVR